MDRHFSRKHFRRIIASHRCTKRTVVKLTFIDLPARWISFIITACQLTQMVVGCIVNFWAYHVKNSGGDCDVSYLNINLALLMYFSYFVLFAHFFHKAYFAKKPLTQKKTENGVISNGTAKKLE